MNFNLNLDTLLKIQSLLVYTILVSFGIILFLPNELIQALYLYQFKETYDVEISATFLLSLVFDLGLIGKSIYKRVD